MEQNIKVAVQQRIKVHLYDLANDLSYIKDEEQRHEMMELLYRLDDINKYGTIESRMPKIELNN